MIMSALLGKLWLPATAFALGVTVGAWGIYKLYHIGEVRALKKAIAEQRDEHARDLAIVAGHHKRALTIAQDEIHVREVIKHVPINNDCDLNADAVRMLDRARQGVPSTTAGASEKAGATATDRSVSQRAIAQAHADCGIRYRRVASQLDALIDWHKKGQE